jgi:hypothetical protein
MISKADDKNKTKDKRIEDKLKGITYLQQSSTWFSFVEESTRPARHYPEIDTWVPKKREETRNTKRRRHCVFYANSTA